MIRACNLDLKAEKSKKPTWVRIMFNNLRFGFFGLVFNWTGEKKLLATYWSPWQDLTIQLCAQNVD